LFEEIDPALVKFDFVHVLDCHEHSDTGIAVPPVAALPVSIYVISNTVTVCCYSCYGAELFIVPTVRQSVSTVSVTLSLSAVTVVTVLNCS